MLRGCYRQSVVYADGMLVCHGHRVHRIIESIESWSEVYVLWTDIWIGWLSLIVGCGP
jgi:hypothetical protein